MYIYIKYKLYVSYVENNIFDLIWKGRHEACILYKI